MNNEETIIMQPQNNKKAEEVKNTVETPEIPVAEPAKKEKKTGKGKKVAATVGAAAMGGAVGGAGTVAAANHMSNAEDTEEVEAEVVEEAAAPVAETKPEPAPAPEEEKIDPQSVDSEGNPDYTNTAGANTISEAPEPQPINNPQEEAPQVEILGIYQDTDENGNVMEAVLMTDGEVVAAVVDGDGDGEADVLIVDANGNQVIEEDEVMDLTGQHVQMSGYEEAYMAQQVQADQPDNMLYAASDVREGEDIVFTEPVDEVCDDDSSYDDDSADYDDYSDLDVYDA